MKRIESLEDVVAVSIHVDARPETVFEILSTGSGISGWLNGEATIDPVVGSTFRIRFPRFQTTISGEVLSVEENRQLSLSWGAEEGPQAEVMPAGSTRVTFDLTPEGEGTRVQITHDDLPNEQEEQNHRQGWRFHASRLDLISNRRQLAADLPARMDRYYLAWSTADAEVRDGLFEETCLPDVAFADDYAVFEGVSTLSTHAGNTRRYLPDTVLRRGGEPVICRGEALVPWQVVDGAGKTVFEGTDHVRVAGDGRLAAVTGFWSTHPPL